MKDLKENITQSIYLKLGGLLTAGDIHKLYNIITTSQNG